MKSTARSSSSGTTVSIKGEQGLEALKLTLAKSSVLDTIEKEPVQSEVLTKNKEPVTTEYVKENGSVVKDLPDALHSMNELLDLSAVLSNFSHCFTELQQQMEWIAESIDSLYKLQNVESEVVVMLPKSNASSSGSSAASVLSSSKQIDKFIDNMNKLPNTKESQMVVMVPEPNSSTLGSYVAPVLSSSNQIGKSTDYTYTLQNNESEVVMTVPEPNALDSGSFGPSFLSSSNQVDKSIDSIYKLQIIKESEVLMTAPEPNVSTSRTPCPPVLSSSNQINHFNDNIYKLQNVEESEVVVVEPKSNASTSWSSAPPVSSSSNPVVQNPDNVKSFRKASCVNLKVLCRDMAGRGFRKYIQSQLSDVERIREDAVAALKCAPDPAKFVLKSIGGFYQTSRKSYSYEKNSPAIISRRACLLILEFFLLSNCTSIEPSIKKEAELGAIEWRKRLIKEGGFSHIRIEDAQGLLLLVASYGIPSDFSNEDLIELIRLSKLSKAWEIANALGQSHFLIERICDIIEGMMEKGIVMTPVEVSHSVGTEEKFPPERILSSFLQVAKEACNIATSSKCSPEALKEANEKKLTAFRTVAKCLEDYKIAPTELSGCSIHSEIAQLEKVSSDINSAIGRKRKAYVTDNSVIEFGRQQWSHVNKFELMKGNSDVDTSVGGKRKADVNNDFTVFVNSEAKQPRTSSVILPQIPNTSKLPQELKASGLTYRSTFNGGHLSHFIGFSGVSSAMGSAPSASTESGALHRTLTGNFAEASVAHTAESEVVVTVPEPNASTSASSAVTVLSASHKMDGQKHLHMNSIGDTIDNMHKLQNVKESEVVVTASEPKGLISVSSGARILSFSDQMVGRSDNGETCKKVYCTELEKHCINMSGGHLRKYIRFNRSDIEQIRKEAPTALMRAPNPAQLVLAAIGQFYLQSRRAYKKYFAHNTYNRQASLFILEFFLLSGCTSIDPAVKMEAEITAISWRSRLLSEGGYRKASNADARGLLLLVASYGIPSRFSNEDLMELVRLSNVTEISNALQRSPFLKERISDIIQEMVEKKNAPGAVEAACSFGLEENFPPETILSSFLQESMQAWKRDTFSQPSYVALIEANQKHLDAFKAVAKCLEDCKISPTKLEEWNINTEIANLEKVVSDLYQIIEEKGILDSIEAKKSETIRTIKRMLKKKQKVNKYSDLKTKRPRMSKGAPPKMHNTCMLPQEQMTLHTAGESTFYNGGHLGLTGPNLHQNFSANVAEASTGHGAWTGGPLLRTIPGNVAEASFSHAPWAGSAFHRTTFGNVAETSAGHTAGTAVMTHRTTPGNVSEAGVSNAAQTDVAFHRKSPGNVAKAGVWNDERFGDVLNIEDGTLNHNSIRDIRSRPASFAPPASEQGFFGQPSATMHADHRKSGSSLYDFVDSF